MTHIPSLGPYELYPKGFDDRSPLFITDCDFVSHASSQVGPHPKWQPDSRTEVVVVKTRLPSSEIPPVPTEV